MAATTQTILHAFIERSPKERRSLLLGHLSAEGQKALSAPTSLFGDPIKELQSEKNTPLEMVHASWIAPKLRTFAQQEIRLFISSLKEPQRSAVKKELLLSNHAIPLTPFAEHFLRRHLLMLLTQQQTDLLPLSCLPASPLNALLRLKHSEFSLLLSLLGLHDVSTEIKQIIDTVKLRAIETALSKEQAAYLQILSQKKEPVLFKRLGLSTWNGNEEVLQAMIFQRGLNRLGKALYEQNPSLLWYLSRSLEIKAGEELLRFVKPLDHLDAKAVLLQQVEHLMTHLHIGPSL